MSRTIRVVDGFDDPAVAADRWREALSHMRNPSVFSTRDWLSSWWTCLGRGELLLTVCQDDGHTVAIAPWFADGSMLFFLGVGSSDYLDIVGACDETLLAELIEAASERVPGFVGARLHHLRACSATLAATSGAASRLGLHATEEYRIVAPAVGLESGGARRVADRTSLQRHTRWFERNGDLSVTPLNTAAQIEAALPGFFDQHVRRWADTGSPSLFVDPREQRFYAAAADAGVRAGWLRFTRVDWNGEAIVYHFGASFDGTYLWYKPSFAVELASRSPGEVLLRHLFLAAADEGAREFDFGIGDEAFKHRFADQVRDVVSVGLYANETASS